MIRNFNITELSAAQFDCKFVADERKKSFDALTKILAKGSVKMAMPMTDKKIDGDGVSVAFGTSEEDEKAREKTLMCSSGSILRKHVDDDAVKILKKYFFSLTNKKIPEVLRHSAFLTHTLFIHVPKNIRFQKPINITWSGASSWAATHVLVVLEEGAHVVIEEEHDGDEKIKSSNATSMRSHIVEAVVHDGASLIFKTLTAFDARTTAWMQHVSSVAKHAKMHWQSRTNGGAHVTDNVYSTLVGAHATSAIDSIFHAREKQNFILSAHNNFLSAFGEGEIILRGVAEGTAHVKALGTIEIGEQGSGTHTYLTEDVLMLDTTARVDAIPALEIRTNDVKASHSATVHRVTPEDLFYFASRGIEEKKAKEMFVEGFLA